MLPYTCVISIVIAMVLLAPRKRINVALWSFVFVVLLLFVGLRNKVGMDWNNYLFIIQRINSGSFFDALSSIEPGYGAVLWISGQLGLGIYGANFVGAAILLAGVFSYSRTTPSPWISLLVSIPYLVVVVGMSANRQSIAAGFLLLAVAKWDKSSFFKRAVLIGIATMFHYSAILFLIFALSDLKLRLSFKIFLSGLVGAVVIYVLQISGAAETYDSIYVSGQTEATVSTGAFFHIILNAGPALIWLFWYRYRGVLLPNNLHMQMAILAIILIPMAFLYSTAASRVSIYLFPVSMYIFSALPVLLERRSILIYRLACSSLFMAVLAFWLLASNSGHAYLPYGNYFFVDARFLEYCC